MSVLLYKKSFIKNEIGGKSLDYNNQVKNRIKRIEGQLRGILKMMEEDKDCKEVITQLSAARTAIDRTIGVIVSSNLVECVRHADANGQNAEELVKEAVNLLVKSR
jgi:DNA-binding FrmR family transcriptional regulator